MKRLAPLALIAVAVLVVAISFVLLTANAQDEWNYSLTPDNNTWIPDQVAPIESTPTPTETPSPAPTPTPTPKVVPGSPLSVGSESFEELLSQLDIMSLAQLVLVGLGIMWAVIILVFTAKKVVDRVTGEKRKEP
jgi:hypothetical protein